MTNLFSNKRISPRKRMLNPVISAIVSFLLPGAAQLLNGQVVKGGIVLLLWWGLYDIAELGAVFYTVVKILRYIIMIVVSSDAYFIASRMKQGEEVRAWSILFFDIQPPSRAMGSVSRNQGKGRTLITDVTLVDGTGAPATKADVLLEGGIIGCIRPHLERKEKEYTIVEGKGRILIPGIINPCCCYEADILGEPEQTGAVRQGITTEVLGQNGQSFAPVKENGPSTFFVVHGKGTKEKTFDNTGMYLLELERLPYPARLESMVGYGTIRNTVFGCHEAAPDEAALQRLCSRVRSSLASGAKGLSLGLAYFPCSVVKDAELLAIMRVVAETEKLVSVQLPVGEGTLIPALKRVGELARHSGAQVLITSFHAFGADRALGKEVCAMVETLRADGVDISLAITGLETQVISLAALTPASMWMEGIFKVPNTQQEDALLKETSRKIDAVGGASKVTILAQGNDSIKKPITLKEASLRLDCTPAEFVFTLLKKNDGCAIAEIQIDDREFAAEFFAKSFVTLCTDGQLSGYTDYAVPHFLGYYVQEKKVLSLEAAVHRTTMEQAARFKMWDRGLIREGMIADLVLLRPELLPTKVMAGATRGISKVWVAGVLQYDTEPNLDLSQLPKKKILGIETGVS